MSYFIKNFIKNIRYKLQIVILILSASFLLISCYTSPKSDYYRVIAPSKGIYHSAYPDFTDEEDVVTKEAIQDFIQLAGKGIVWAYFSNNWINGISFPRKELETIKDMGIVPFVRLMARSTFDEGPDPVYTLQKIIDGVFDRDIINWAKNAREYNSPIMIEFGTEVNGDWFGWCGANNGGGETSWYGDPDKPDGPERFVDAYKHIINIFRVNGVRNVTWAFHVDSHPEPDPYDPEQNAEWNKMANYYPGDDYIDWIGISVYGAIDFSDDWESFTEVLDRVWDEFSSISTSKPLAILEWGVMDNYPGKSKAKWISDALEAIKSGRYPGIKAISYWNEEWEIEPTNGYNTINLRIDSSPEVLEAYRNGISSDIFISTANIESE